MQKSRMEPATGSLFFRSALLPGGWAENVRISYANGSITGVEVGILRGADEESHALGLPGMPNLHSHSFQRAMAGLAERRGDSEQNFWSWRGVMYRFAQALTPEDVEIIATQAFIEMLETGFCAVAEFHYLHHDEAGKPYADIGEMASRLAAAAGLTGISLLLLPVFYAHANFGGIAPEPEQRRFINDLDSFARLVTACRKLGPTGIAPHSLRAVTPAELHSLMKLAEGAPIHIHIAEQMREVADCLAWSKARPIEFLLGETELSPNWCLVHATHGNDAELAAVAKSGAVVGLCPITEANLGDGIFDAGHFLADGGSYGIGSDSNVLISVAQELRQLEYSQRLRRQQRNVIAGSSELYQSAVAGGGAALGVATGLRPGAPANVVSLAVSRMGDGGLAQSIFASRENLVDCVWVDGQKRVAGGRHPLAEASRQRFDALLRRLELCEG
jgi:formimidoylglutamate deiminase